MGVKLKLLGLFLEELWQKVVFLQAEKKPGLHWF